MKKFQQISVLFAISLLITACQTTPKKTAITVAQETSQPTITEKKPSSEQAFTINGKIGLVSPNQAGSAFYVWSQRGKSFEIELAGAMNLGQTNISYNGKTATLTNEKGTLTADTPEDLLQQSTGWQAPISQLSYWIMGNPAPSDSEHQFDNQQRLTTADNHGWQATFEYSKNSEKLPNRITVRHADGYRVVLSINHLSND